MAERSDFTKAVLSIVEEYRTSRERARKGGGIPLMQEKLSARDARNRIMRMTPAERMNLVQQIGAEEVLRIVNPSRGTGVAK